MVKWVIVDEYFTGEFGANILLLLLSGESLLKLLATLSALLIILATLLLKLSMLSSFLFLTLTILFVLSI